MTRRTGQKKKASHPTRDERPASAVPPKLRLTARFSPLTESPGEPYYRQSCTTVSAAFAGSFPPILQFEKLEIHTAFLHFSNFDWKKNLSANALAKLRGIAFDSGRSSRGKAADLRQMVPAPHPLCSRLPIFDSSIIAFRLFPPYSNTVYRALQEEILRGIMEQKKKNFQAIKILEL